MIPAPAKSAFPKLSSSGVLLMITIMAIYGNFLFPIFRYVILHP
jgi:hypothetical protein